MWKNPSVHKFHRLFVALALCFITASPLFAADSITLHPRGGEPVQGEPFDTSEAGVRLKLEDGTYMSKPIPWGMLSQQDLQTLSSVYQSKPSVLAFIEPFKDTPVPEKIHKTDIGSTNAPPRLEYSAPKPFFSALASSPLGLLMLLLLYLGNLYAALEIAVFRSRPPAVVCGLAAVLPVLAPIMFLAMPTRVMHAAEESIAGPDAGLEAAIAADQAASSTHARSAPRHPTTQSVAAAATNLPATRVFARGQYTFNRRFFETQMPGYFAVVRPNQDKEMLLIIKAARGNYIAERISRISAADLFITVRKGHASEEIGVNFNEIQEVTLKHNDA